MRVCPCSRRQALRLAATGLPLWAMPAAFAQVGDLNDAVNQAGRQRMLCQRMVKAWLARGLQVMPERADKVLAESMALFDRQLLALTAFAPTAEILATYQRLAPLWQQFRQALSASSPSAAAAPALLALDAQVLALAQQGTQQLELHGGQPLGRLVNIAGRQRMLSQRMAKFQLGRRWQAAADAPAQINRARQEFLAALDLLNDAPQATATIRQELQLARQQWVFFDNALRKADNAGAQDATDLFVSSENILQVMDRITGLYTRLGA
jgi:hypothetical protein